MKRIALPLALCLSFSAQAEVFKCKESGRTIYSQQPCSDSAQVVEDKVSVSGYGDRSAVLEPYAVGKQLEASRRAQPVQVVQQQPAPPADCKYEESVLENIRNRMRAGYTAYESNILHERQREAMAAVDDCKKRLRGR